MALHISVTSRQSDIVREYHEGIKFDRPYEVGLKSFVTYNSIFNITEANNKLTFIWRENESVKTLKTSVPQIGDDEDDEEFIEAVFLNERSKRSAPPPPAPVEYTEAAKTKKVTRVKEVAIPPGVYEITDIASHIKENLPPKKFLTIRLNKNTLGVEMQGNIVVDLTSPQSIASTLGFERRVYPRNTLHSSTRMLDIFPINMIRIRCNLVKNNVEDERLNVDTIYEFPLTALPGEKIIERPFNTTFYRLNTNVVYQLHLKIVDQDNHPIDFRDERINIVLEFRPTL